MPLDLAITAVGLVSSLALTLGSPAAAQTDGAEGAPAATPSARQQAFGRPGVYLAVAGGGLIDTFDLPDVLTEGMSQAAFVGGKIGSRHNRWIATETSVDYAVKGFDMDGANFGFPGVNVEVSPLYLSGNVKLFALDGRFQPWVAGGIGGAWAFIEATSGTASASATVGSFLGRIGGGLDVYLAENVAFGPELYWNITTGDLEQIRTLSIGANLFFRF